MDSYLLTEYRLTGDYPSGGLLTVSVSSDY